MNMEVDHLITRQYQNIISEQNNKIIELQKNIQFLATQLEMKLVYLIYIFQKEEQQRDINMDNLDKALQEIQKMKTEIKNSKSKYQKQYH